MQRLLEPEDHDNGDMLILEDHSHNLISMLGLKTDFEVWVGIQTQSILNFKIEDLLGMRNFFSRPVIITSVMGLLSIFPQRIIYGCGMAMAC